LSLNNLTELRSDKPLSAVYPVRD